MALEILDISIIIGYLGLLLWSTYRSTQKATSEDFLIAGRKVGVIETLSTINATKTGSIILIFVALLYAYGTSALWYFVGMSTGYLLFIPFATRLYKQFGKRHYTLAQYFFEKYGSRAGICASVINIALMLAWLMLNIIAGSKVISYFTSWSFTTSTILVSCVVLSYLIIGGFKAVTTTDVFQYGAIIITFIAFAYIAGSSTIPSTEFTFTTVGFDNIIAFFLIGILVPFSAPELWQRVYAAKNADTLRKGILYSVVIYVVVACLLAFIGLSIKAQFPNVAPDTALIHGLATLLPNGLIGLAVVLFFAAFMSSIDTYAYTAASSLVHDFFHQLSKKNTVRAIRYTVTAMVIGMSAIAIVVQDLIIGSFIFVGYAVILSIPVLITWIKKTTSHYTIQTALLFSIPVLTLFVVKGVLTKTLSPAIILVSIAISIVGLVFGAIVAYFKKKKTKKKN